MRVSFIKDYPSTDINIDLYLTEQNPVTYPIGSSDATLRGNVKNALLKSYGAKINIKEDTTDNSALNFDKNYLFPIKQGQKTLKGGAYFEPIGAPTGSGNTLHQYTAVVNTRSPTSFYSIQTVAAQAYIN